MCDGAGADAGVRAAAGARASRAVESDMGLRLHWQALALGIKGQGTGRFDVNAHGLTPGGQGGQGVTTQHQAVFAALQGQPHQDLAAQVFMSAHLAR